jgi:hypothetical protein
MLFVIPVSKVDVHLLKGLTDVMILLGGLQRHSVLFAPAPSVLQQASEEAIRLRAVCDRVQVEAVAREPHGDWPLACNIHFRDVVELLDLRGIQEPWFFMEADCTPRFAGYPDRLELEYRKRGLPFMGVLRNTGDVAKKQDGSPLDSSRYMVGAGIYPPNFKEYSCLYKATGQHSGKASPPLPFDVRIRHEVGPKCWNTDLIAHHRSTGNYRIEGGKLICDDYNRQEGNASYAGEISDMAFVIHGCKDGSLAQLVLGGMNSTSGPVRGAVETPPPADTPKELFARALKATGLSDEQIEAKWQELSNPAPQKPVEASNEPKGKEPEKPKDAPEAAQKPKAEVESPDHDEEQQAELDKIISKPAQKSKSLRSLVEKSITPVDIGSAAADLGVSQKMIKDLIALNDSGLAISKGRWIVLVETAETT